MSRPVIEVLETGTGVVEVLVPGFPGADGIDGQGLPTGGTTGQFLRKQSNVDGDFAWADERALASQAQAEAGSDNTTVMTPLRVAQAKADRVPVTRQVAAGTGLEGGGALSSDVTLALSYASQVEAETATNTTKVMTPLRTAQAISSRLVDNLLSSSTTEALTANQGRLLELNKISSSRQVIAGTGLTGGGDLSANRTLSIDIASQAEAEAGANNTRVMTPLRTAQALATRVAATRQVIAGAGLSGGGDLSADVTLALAPASNAEAVAGVNNTKAMTPLRVAEVLGDVVRDGRQIIAGSGLAGGGDLASNRTLSADYASQADAQAGTNNTKLMTPLRVAEAIAALGGGGLTVPQTRQVLAGTGLTGGGALSSDVTLSADLASQGEAEAGVSDTRLMTPLRVAQQLAVSTADVVRTSRQVLSGTGLSGGGALSGNVTLSADLASQAQAQAGTDNTKLMTPLRVKEAIDALVTPGGSINVTSGTAINSVPIAGGYRIDASIASISSAQNGVVENTLMTPERVHQAITARVVNSNSSTSTTDPVSAAQVTSLNQSKADKSIVIDTIGGITGGGSLAGNRTLSLVYATTVDAIAGTDGSKVVTPVALQAALNNNPSRLTPQWLTGGGGPSDPPIVLEVGKLKFYSKNISPRFIMPGSSSPGQILGVGAFYTYEILQGQSGLNGRIMGVNATFEVDRTNIILTFMCFQDSAGYTDWRIV